MRFPAINPAANKSVRTQVFWRSRYVPGLAVMGAIASYFLLARLGNLWVDFDGSIVGDRIHD